MYWYLKQYIVIYEKLSYNTSSWSMFGAGAVT